MKKRTYTLISKELVADLDTPASLYLKLKEEKSFLLESISDGEHIGRYSFIGLKPLCELRNENDSTQIIFNDEHIIKTQKGAIDTLEELMQTFDIKNKKGLERIVQGAVGYFSWNVISEIEEIDTFNKKETPFPRAHFVIPRYIVAFDHAFRKIVLVGLAEPDDDMIEKVSEYLEGLTDTIAQPLNKSSLINLTSSDDIFKNVKSNFMKEELIQAIETAKKHIYEGDVFQLVLSQKFCVKSEKDHFDVYRALRSINPSPYMYYLSFNDYTIIGSSPEVLVKLENKVVTVRPIAGTRKRNDAKEAEVTLDLQTDEKERAEHIMLVDLGRNDMGRICESGSINISDLMKVEKYSHVLHMVTTIKGKLMEGKTAFDVLKATFPAGTLSGAPKIRAIEIINRLEPEQRGPYGGALGYINFNGNMDMCIVIRTICVKGTTFYIQAGMGVVADSDPEKEFEETRSKARGVIAACF